LHHLSHQMIMSFFRIKYDRIFALSSLSGKRSTAQLMSANSKGNFLFLSGCAGDL